jgi:hypothetical protein
MTTGDGVVTMKGRAVAGNVEVDVKEEINVEPSEVTSEFVVMTTGDGVVTMKVIDVDVVDDVSVEGVEMEKVGVEAEDEGVEVGVEVGVVVGFVVGVEVGVEVDVVVGVEVDVVVGVVLGVVGVVLGVVLGVVGVVVGVVLGVVVGIVVGVVDDEVGLVEHEDPKRVATTVTGTLTVNIACTSTVVVLPGRVINEVVSEG